LSFLVDCWDGEDGEPIVYHGWTLTTKLLFRDILVDAIVPYAFRSSLFPLVLSIENHCSVEQQDKLADHLRVILGDLLYLGKVDEGARELPSPESLQRKILVKGKKLHEGQEDLSEEEDEEEEEEEEEGEMKKKKKQLVS
jgi:hypothetical protein